MSYNGSGTFQINTTGQPVVTGTVISSTAFNALTADLATGLSTAITKDGQTATTARIPFAAGISSTLVTDSSSVSTGSIITAGGVGVAKALYVGTTANIAGVLSTTSPNITTSITTPSTSFDLINATATTLNLGGAATTFNVGAATGTMTVANTTLAAKAITASTTLGVTGAATLSSTLTYGGVTLTNAVTGTGKMVLDTSPTLVTPALGTPASGVLTNCTGVQYNGFKNRIINGAFGIWQRGTTYALPTTANYGSADRWAFWQATSANGVANQVASGLAGFQYAVKLGRNSGATTTGGVVATQAFETVNSLDLAGQSITFSFYAKAGANFSASGNSISCVVSSGTGTDQSVVSLNAGTWTGGATVLSSSSAITTSWVRYTFTGTVASNATQVGLQIYYIPTGTAGADDNLYITGVQLEKGSTATSFDYRPYGTELALCQRYYETSDALVLTTAWTTIINNVYWKVTKRATPSTITTTVTSGSGAVFASFGTGVSLVYQSVVNSVASSATVTASSEL